MGLSACGMRIRLFCYSQIPPSAPLIDTISLPSIYIIYPLKRPPGTSTLAGRRSPASTSPPSSLTCAPDPRGRSGGGKGGRGEGGVALSTCLRISQRSASRRLRTALMTNCMRCFVMEPE
ncbi:hypothetical protein BOTBODRAFT_446100 [Botryobasidium botryosum FD-172 SS1]|uniref:Uncharacterized protein n=1 Tax=Botryobasidium botryosum (strain FD-172 SS1) TaxID=930990 RepID=A0A067MIQ6_BOTB1|nr:hypothetical protein BOTBODRAFT_446100 [Botryobasidium botryosum FD-172 SS1]